MPKISKWGNSLGVRILAHIAERAALQTYDECVLRLLDSGEVLMPIARERDSIERQLQKADQRSKMVTLTAPTDAVVLEIAKLSPVSIIREAETFFTLVPLNSVLEAEVQLNSVDVGYISRLVILCT